MSERPQNLMRSRCPECGTVFRVTSEQLRLKAGKVRCGQCRTVFNAFDQLLVGAGGQDNPPTIMPMPSIAPLPDPPKAARSAGAIAPAIAPARTAEPIAPPPAEEPGAEGLAAVQPDPDTDSSFPARQTTVEQGVGLPAVATELPAAETATSGPEPAAETLEQTLQAARAAGLVAAREVGDSPAYNRWSAAPVSAGGLGDFDEPASRPLWPYLLLLLILLFVLLGQLAHVYRTPLTLRVPALMPIYQMLGIDVPLPREVDLISIEASDLQADPGRGLFVLNSTLKNRAAYAQAWPQLTLTLTDVNDRTVARRTISVVDYLGAQHPPSFAAGSDVGVRLWIEARDIGAAGYRLYLFYPES